MPGFFQNVITVTVAQFEEATSKKLGRRFGWDSDRMDSVRARLGTYWARIGVNTFRDLRDSVKVWHERDASEFRSRDAKTGGICTRLLSEVNSHAERGEAVKAVILRGRHNLLATKHAVPRVSMHDMTVTALMDEARHMGGVGVIVVDLYGDSLQAQGLDKRYDGGETVLQNIVSVLRFAKREGLPVINFTMPNCRTIGPIARELPDRRIDHEKPTNNAFTRTPLDQFLKDARCLNWVVLGFDANMCVAATIFGSKSDFQPTGKKVAAMPGSLTMVDEMKQGWMPGLLDRGYNVITSRLILGSGNGTPLHANEGWPNLGPTN